MVVSTLQLREAEAIARRRRILSGLGNCGWRVKALLTFGILVLIALLPFQAQTNSKWLICIQNALALRGDFS